MFCIFGNLNLSQLNWLLTNYEIVTIIRESKPQRLKKKKKHAINTCSFCVNCAIIERKKDQTPVARWSQFQPKLKSSKILLKKNLLMNNANILKWFYLDNRQDSCLHCLEINFTDIFLELASQNNSMCK